MSRPIVDLSENNENVRTGEKYGIEVEAEGCPYERHRELSWSASYDTYWRATADGSLRNGGIEFLSKPLIRSQVPSAIEALWPYFEARRMVPSVRTGIHIHCSFLGKTIEDAMRMMTHYALVEPQLYAFVGPEREENIYCIPWYRANDEPVAVRQWLMARESGSTRWTGRLEREPCKYSGLFAGPLSRLGTIEFRHAPTFTDAQTMLRWWQIVQAVWRTCDTTYDVMAEWRRLGPVAFTKSVLPFSWLTPVDEKVYEHVDVEAVAECLLAPPEPVPAFWGKAPELKTKGKVPSRPAPGRRTPPRSPAPARIPELTVNVGRAQESLQDAVNRRNRERDFVQRLMGQAPPAAPGAPVEVPLPVFTQEFGTDEVEDLWSDDSDDDDYEPGPDSDQEEF